MSQPTVRSTTPSRGSTAAGRVHLPDGSRSAQSPWVWRGLLLMSLIALGLCLTLLSGGKDGFAAAWGTIAAGWFGFSMWLWRQHTRARG